MKRFLAPILLVILLFPSLALGLEIDDLVERNGPWVEYQDNGQLSEKGTYKDGRRNGPWVHYWTTGGLWIEENYKDGERDGLFVEY
jgi:antitoxin component YwqK of YwqJK toxin-antitoxin module